MYVKQVLHRYHIIMRHDLSTVQSLQSLLLVSTADVTCVHNIAIALLHTQQFGIIESECVGLRNSELTNRFQWLHVTAGVEAWHAFARVQGAASVPVAYSP